MKLVAFTNTGNETKHIGGKAVKSGETRELVLLYINFNDADRFFGEINVKPGEAARVPLIHFENPNADADKAQEQIFVSLLDESVEFIQGIFPDMSDEELAHIRDMETKEQKSRKTLLSAIDDELAVREAEASFDGKAYQQALLKMSEEDLQLELLSAGDNPEKLQFVQVRLSELKGA